MRTSSTRTVVVAVAAAITGSVFVARAPRVEAAANAQKVAQKAAPKIAWRKSFASALAEARRTRKPLLIDFNAVWCAPCKELDRKTFSSAVVVAQSRRFVAVKVDVDKEPKIATRYGVQALPTVAVLKPNGTMSSQFFGFRDAAYTVNFLRNAAKKAR